jgi:hypothetical protein
MVFFSQGFATLQQLFYQQYGWILYSVYAKQYLCAELV